MSDLNVQLKYQNKQGGYDHLYPKTKAGLVQMEDGSTFQDHAEALDQRHADLIQGFTDADLTSAPEIIEARESHPTLLDNLQSYKQVLAQKVGGGVKAEPEDMSDRMLGLVTGTGGPINLLSIPQDGSVTHQKTDFLTTGKNLFDKTKIADKYVRANGTMSDSTYFHTDFIPITNGQSLSILGSNRGTRTARFTAYYDIQKQILPQYGSDTGTTGPITATGAEIAYVVLSFQRIYLDNGLDLMIEYGTTKSAYEPFRLLPTEKVRLSDVQKEEIVTLIGDTNPATQPIKGKRILNFGDSIAAGDGNSGKGYAEIIAEKYGAVCVDYALGGATLTKNLNATNNIVAQVDTAIATETVAPDFIFVNGRTNDLNSAYSTLLQVGSLTSGYDTTAFAYDLNTFTGSYEYILAKLRNKWANAIIIVVSPHNMGSRDVTKQKDLHTRTDEIRRKWSVGLADLFTDGQLNTSIPAMHQYTNPTTEQPNGDRTHPNDTGYRKFYVPVLVQEMLRYLQ